MFKFLKDKLKNVVSAFSKKVEEESTEVEPKDEPKSPTKVAPPKIIEAPKAEIKEIQKPVHIEQPKPEVHKPVPKELPENIEVHHEEKKEEKIEKKAPLEIKEHKKGFFSRIFGKKEEHIPEKKVQEIIKPVEETVEEKKKILEEKEKPEEKKGFFGGIVQKFTHLELSDKKFEELFWDLEVTLLENNVAVEVIDKIKADLKKSLVGVPIRKSEINNKIVDSLRRSIEELFDVPALNVVDKIKGKKPFVILFLGINGAGKTTTIAKFAHMLKGLGYKVVVAAGDTFRAAAIQQLETHANTIGVKIIKHDYGSDAAAVAFDAIAYAKSKEIDVVLIDTAGRLHSNINLMDELKKIVRVSNPDMKIFIGESITGNDCVEQAKQFNEAIGIDGIILSKADVDEKGGAAISVSYVTGKPILYLGVGQNYQDLQEFNKKTVIEGLGLG